MNLIRMRVVLVTITLLLVGCDHGTKFFAKNGLQDGPPRPLVQGVFDLDYVENRHTGFGMLGSVPETIRRPLLTSLQLVSGTVFLLLGLRRNLRPAMRACLLLVSAGAIGNGLDRLMRGYVVDFFYLHHWPVFNVADIYITAGGILLLIASHRRKQAQPVPAGPA